MSRVRSLSRWLARSRGVWLAGLVAGCGTAPGLDATGGETTLKTAIVTCPLITDLRVQPLSTSVGNSIDLSAATAADGGALFFAWSAPAGVFSDSSGRKTSYTCTRDGDQKILLLVSDGQCGDLAEAPVACVPAGNAK